MERVRLDDIRFFILPFPAAGQACVRGTRGAYDLPSQKVGQRFRRANRLRSRQMLAIVRHRDECRPYNTKAISPPRCVAGGFQRGDHIPLWRVQVPNASLTCVWNRKKPGADMETARLRGGGMQRAASDARLHPISFCTSRKKWGGIDQGASRNRVPTSSHRYALRFASKCRYVIASSK